MDTYSISLRGDAHAVFDAAAGGIHTIPGCAALLLGQYIAAGRRAFCELALRALEQPTEGGNDGGRGQGDRTAHPDRARAVCFGGAVMRCEYLLEHRIYCAGT